MAGYRVLVASDGAEAVEVFQAAKGQVALAVLDASMPRMSGRQAFDAIRKIEPGVKVLFASGYLLSDTGPDTRSLHKPYTPSQLAAAVHEMITAPAGT